MLAKLFLLPFLASEAAPDYFHYIKSGASANFDSREAVADGVTLYKWNGTDAGIADMRADVCAHNVLEWDAGNAAPYPSGDAWHAYDMVYFVAQGNASLTVGGETKVMKTGDTVWIQAGVSHSGLVPVDNRGGVIVDALKVPFEPQTTAAPSRSSGSGQFRFYMASEDLTPPDVTKLPGPNKHYEWYGESADPDVLHVWWKPSARMPCHSHAEGALYVTAWGKMCFDGESSGDSCRTAGEARWTKPGYQYANEAAGPDGSEIIVMNIHTNPQMCRAVV